MYATPTYKPGVLTPLSQASIFQSPHYEFCDANSFSKHFKILQVQGPGEKVHSASKTVIVFAEYVAKMSKPRYTRVAMKFFVHRDTKLFTDQDDLDAQRRLVSEYDTYGGIIERIYKDNNGVNFVRPIYNFICSVGFISDLRGIPNTAKLGRELAELSLGTPAVSRVGCIITELRPSVVSLYDYIVRGNPYLIPEHDLNAIFLQVIHALYICEVYRLQHNDLHMDNILVDLAPDEKHLNYRCIDSKGREHAFKLDLTLMTRPAKIMLFDWDFATSEDKMNPGLATMCRRFGICPEFQPGLDLYYICRLIQRLIPKLRGAYQDFFRRLTDTIITVLPDGTRPGLMKQVRDGYPCMEMETANPLRGGVARINCAGRRDDTAVSRAARQRFEKYILTPGNALAALETTLFRGFSLSVAASPAAAAAAPAPQPRTQPQPGADVSVYTTGDVLLQGPKVPLDGDIYVLSRNVIFQFDREGNFMRNLAPLPDKRYKSMIAPVGHPYIYLLTDGTIFGLHKYGTRENISIKTDANSMTLLTYRNRTGMVEQFLLLSTPSSFRFASVEEFLKVKNTEELQELRFVVPGGYKGFSLPQYRILGSITGRTGGINYLLVYLADRKLDVLRAKLTEGFIEISMPINKVVLPELPTSMHAINNGGVLYVGDGKLFAASDLSYSNSTLFKELVVRGGPAEIVLFAVEELPRLGLSSELKPISGQLGGGKARLSRT